MPVFSSWFLSRRIREEDGWIVRGAKAVYAPLLRRAFAVRGLIVIAAVLLLFAGAGPIFRRLGAEFIPNSTRARSPSR